MELAIKRILLSLFPSLAAGYHLPMFARVESWTLNTPDGATCELEKPYFSVDLVVLGTDLKPNTRFPTVTDVILPVGISAGARGIWGKPDVGTIVELAFAYGSPQHPFIRTILPHLSAMPELNEASMRWLQSEKSYQQVDEDGSWSRVTDQDITDTSNNLTEAVEHTADRLAKAFNRMRVEEGGRIYIGNDAENLLRLVSELIAEVKDLANTCASHSHSAFGAPPNQASAFTAHSSGTQAIGERLDSMVE